MIPRPNLEQSVATLSDRDEYKTILNFIREERERMFGDLRQAETPNDVMKVAGSVATLDEMLQILDPSQ
jgi:hypothetical protein